MGASPVFPALAVIYHSAIPVLYSQKNSSHCAKTVGHDELVQPQKQVEASSEHSLNVLPRSFSFYRGQLRSACQQTTLRFQLPYASAHPPPDTASLSSTYFTVHLSTLNKPFKPACPTTTTTFLPPSDTL